MVSEKFEQCQRNTLRHAFTEKKTTEREALSSPGTDGSALSPGSLEAVSAMTSHSKRDYFKCHSTQQQKKNIERVEPLEMMWPSSQNLNIFREVCADKKDVQTKVPFTYSIHPPLHHFLASHSWRNLEKDKLSCLQCSHKPLSPRYSYASPVFFKEYFHIGYIPSSFKPKCRKQGDGK